MPSLSFFSVPLRTLLLSLIAIPAGYGAGAAPLRVTEVALGFTLVSLAAAFVAVTWSVRALGTTLITLAVGTLAMTGVRVTSWMAVSDVLFVFSALVLIPQYISGARTQTPMRRSQAIGVLFMTIGGIVGSFFAAAPVHSDANFLRLFVAAVLIFVLFGAWAPSIREIRLVTSAWILSAGISALWALVDAAGGKVRPSGLATHPNSLGLTSVLALGPALALASGSRRGRAVWLATVAVLLCGVAVSGSRAAAIGSAVVVVVALTFVVRRRAQVVLGAISLALLLLVSGVASRLPMPAALERLLHPSSASVSPSDVGHQLALHGTLTALSRHPIFGVGFENARDALNIYLQIWVSGGLLAVGGYLLFAWASLKPLRNLRPRGGTSKVPDQSVVIATGFAISFLGFLAADTFQNALWERYVWFVPALIGVIRLPETVRLREHERTSPVRHRPASVSPDPTRLRGFGARP